ncbi:hypothetical protein GCM10029992_44770 [Glycomyces albus]
MRTHRASRSATSGASTAAKATATSAKASCSDTVISTKRTLTGKGPKGWEIGGDSPRVRTNTTGK